VRPRELWLWLGAAFLTVGGVLTALAVGYYTARPASSLGASPLMFGAYGVLALAFACFFAAMLAWRPWLRWLRFPDLVISVRDINRWPATSAGPGPVPPIPVRLRVYDVRITNAEADRKASIENAVLVARTKPGAASASVVVTAPSWPVESDGPETHPLQFTVNLDPQTSVSGDLVFEMDMLQLDLAERLADPAAAYIELHDAITGKTACFPALPGTFRRGSGLRPLTPAERVYPMGTAEVKATRQWRGLLGPADP
jgi:hypothetical protein